MGGGGGTYGQNNSGLLLGVKYALSVQMKTPKNFLTVVRGVFKFEGWENVVGGGGVSGRFMLNNILKYIIFEFIFFHT